MLRPSKATTNDSAMMEPAGQTRDAITFGPFTLAASNGFSSKQAYLWNWVRRRWRPESLAIIAVPPSGTPSAARPFPGPLRIRLLARYAMKFWE